MKALKIFFSLVLVCVLVLVVGIGALLWLVDLNDYKKEIEQLAAKQNVILKIEGDLGWSFFPNIGIRSGKLAAQLPLDNLAAPVAFESLRVGFELVPLVLRQEIRASAVEVTGGTLTLKSPETKDLTQIRNLTLTAHDLNLQQQPFDLQLALEMLTESGGVTSQSIELSSVMRLAVDQAIKQVEIASSTHKIRYTGPAVPQAVSVSAEFAGKIDLEKSIANLTALTLAVDDTRLAGTVQAQFGAKPFYDVVLKGDHINLDRYTATTAAGETKKKITAEKKQEPLIPVASVLAFPGNYDITFEKLVVKHLALSDMHLAMHITPDGLMTIKPLKLRLYEGNFNLQGQVDVRSTQPHVALNISLSPLQLEPALKDFLQVDKTFASGDFSFSADLATHGVTTDDMIQALSGKFSFASKAITLNKMDLTSSLDASLLQLLQVKLPALMSADNQTVLTDLNGEGPIQQGVAQPLISAAAPCTQFHGDGSYDVPGSAVDYHLGIMFPAADQNPACADINPRLKDISWPIRCQGSLGGDPAKLCHADQKKIQAILAKAASREAGQKLEKKMDKALQKKFGEDSEQVKGLLKGLLNK